MEPNILGFWTWFAENNARITEIMEGKREGRVTDLIDSALAANGLDFTYEVTEGVFGGELTFTPEGDPQLAAFVDRFVAHAPSFGDWVVFSRVQRKALGTALAFVKALHGVDLEDARFKVVWADERFHLCFLHDGLFALDEDKRYAVVSTFLDHALGEEISMEWVGTLDFKPSGEGVAMGLMINEIIAEIDGAVMASGVTATAQS
jgi:hypothetical protein